MAKASHESPSLPDSLPYPATEVEKQFLDALGPAAGQEVYDHLKAIIDQIDKIPNPDLSKTLRAHIAEHDINPDLIVILSSSRMIVTNSPEMAARLRRETRYDEVMRLGAAILRAPQ